MGPHHQQRGLDAPHLQQPDPHQQLPRPASSTSHWAHSRAHHLCPRPPPQCIGESRPDTQGLWIHGSPPFRNPSPSLGRLCLLNHRGRNRKCCHLFRHQRSTSDGSAKHNQQCQVARQLQSHQPRIHRGRAPFKFQSGCSRTPICFARCYVRRWCKRTRMQNVHGPWRRSKLVLPARGRLLRLEQVTGITQHAETFTSPETVSAGVAGPLVRRIYPRPQRSSDPPRVSSSGDTPCVRRLRLWPPRSAHVAGSADLLRYQRKFLSRRRRVRAHATSTSPSRRDWRGYCTADTGSTGASSIRPWHTTAADSKSV